MRTVTFMLIGVTCCALLGGIGEAATDPASACKDTKARAAGKKAADLITAFGRNFKRPDATRLGFSILKAQSKLSRQFSKAESKGGCATLDDVAAIEAKVDAVVSDVVRDVIPVACDCCAVADRLSFTATTPTGNCGVLRNFRCSNDSNASCVTDGDCELGSCIDPPGICSEDFSVNCSGDDTPCTGTCNEVVGPGLPLDLECGGLYSGWLGPQPSGLSDRGTFVSDVTSCDGGTGGLTLGPTTAVETGSDRTCTSTGCSFGAPVPMDAGPSAAPFSRCAFPSLAQDAGGAGTCNGVMHLDLALTLDVYYGGDLLNSTTPPDVPGVQPCPLCVRQCAGGTNDRFPCADDSDCTAGGTCGATTQCLGGANDTAPCVQGTTDLGDGFPTSHDCVLDPSLFLVALPFDLMLSTGTVVAHATDSANPTAARVFCGFCRDLGGAGSLCFEGDPGPCPGGGASVPVACQSDADCDDGDDYESCAQRDPGAFGGFGKGSTQITLAGSAPDTCLSDGASRPATVASLFCVAPTFTGEGYFDNDISHSLPGPGALTLQGDVTLVP